jgi:hypothetical protein
MVITLFIRSYMSMYLFFNNMMVVHVLNRVMGVINIFS